VKSLKKAEKKQKNMYSLPKLPYGYKDLEPYISEEQLFIHHTKHHKGYVDKANSLLDKGVSKPLSFNLAGHILHSLFWENMRKESGDPEGRIKEEIEKNFGNIENFKKLFSETAVSAEGSAWAVLVYEKFSGKLLLEQIEKHNLFLYPESKILLILDVWEHAYYLDYKNEKAKFVENFWNIANWDKAGERLESAMG